jgi:hypothetical protein
MITIAKQTAKHHAHERTHEDKKVGYMSRRNVDRMVNHMRWRNLTPIKSSIFSSEEDRCKVE